MLDARVLARAEKFGIRSVPAVVIDGIIAREEGGKIRVISGSWDGEKVILKGQVLEVRNVDGRLYVSRKAKKPDEWDPPIAAYDPYGPGTGVAGDDDFVADDATVWDESNDD